MILPVLIYRRSMRKFESFDFWNLQPICQTMKIAVASLLLVCCMAAPAAGQSDGRSGVDRAAAQQRLSALSTASSADRQRASVARMEASVARQRESAAKLSAEPRMPWPEFAPVSPGASMPPFAQAPGPVCEALSSGAMDSLVEAASAQEGIAADLLRAVIKRESANFPCAVSPKGALGLMQLMPSTIKQFEVRYPLDPQENVGAGAKFLKQLLVRYGGDLALALGAYNAGPGRVDAAGGIPAIQETVDYVNDILTKVREQ